MNRNTNFYLFWTENGLLVHAHGRFPVFITLVKCLCGPRYINFLLTIDILSGTNNTAKIFGKNIWKKYLVVLNVKGWIFLNVWGEFRKFLWVANFSQSKVDIERHATESLFLYKKLQFPPHKWLKTLSQKFIKSC